MSVTDIGVTVGGLVAIGFLAWFFLGPKKARQAEVKGNIQEIRITVKGSYSPDVIRGQGGRASAAGVRHNRRVPREAEIRVNRLSGSNATALWYTLM